MKFIENQRPINMSKISYPVYRTARCRLAHAPESSAPARALPSYRTEHQYYSLKRDRIRMDNGVQAFDGHHIAFTFLNGENKSRLAITL